jgi:hypothetical protein
MCRFISVCFVRPIFIMIVRGCSNVKKLIGKERGFHATITLDPRVAKRNVGFVRIRSKRVQHATSDGACSTRSIVSFSDTTHSALLRVAKVMVAWKPRSFPDLPLGSDSLAMATTFESRLHLLPSSQQFVSGCRPWCRNMTLLMFCRRQSG